MKYCIEIKVDTNDADYLTQNSVITEEELNKIRPLIEAIKNFEPYKSKSTGQYKLDWTHGHNYPHGEYAPRFDLGEKTPQQIYPEISDEIHDLFQEYCPYGEHGFHSIESIYVYPEVKKERLL